MLIPFFEIKLTEDQDDLLGIEDIWIGPTPHPILSQYSVESALVTNKVKGDFRTFLTNEKVGIPYIHISDIPYRAW